MTKVLVMTAKGQALDWMVSKCEATLGKWVAPNEKRGTTKWERSGNSTPRYSTNWSQGGPLLFKHKIGTTTEHGCRGVSEWMASTHSNKFDSRTIAFGPDPLIAGMRCLVESILGEIVEVPDELV